MPFFFRRQAKRQLASRRNFVQNLLNLAKRIHKSPHKFTPVAKGREFHTYAAGLRKVVPTFGQASEQRRDYQIVGMHNTRKKNKNKKERKKGEIKLAHPTDQKNKFHSNIFERQTHFLKLNWNTPSPWTWTSHFVLSWLSATVVRSEIHFFAGHIDGSPLCPNAYFRPTDFHSQSRPLFFICLLTVDPNISSGDIDWLSISQQIRRRTSRAQMLCAVTWKTWRRLGKLAVTHTGLPFFLF